MVMLAVGVVAPPIAGNSPLSTQLKPLNTSAKRRVSTVFAQDGFPSFLPKQIHSIKDPFARNLAVRIERLPVTVGSLFLEICSLFSCVPGFSSFVAFYSRGRKWKVLLHVLVFCYFLLRLRSCMFQQ